VREKGTLIGDHDLLASQLEATPFFYSRVETRREDGETVVLQILIVS